jgi:hypothetical protein
MLHACENSEGIFIRAVNTVSTQLLTETGNYGEGNRRLAVPMP